MPVFKVLCEVNLKMESRVYIYCVSIAAHASILLSSTFALPYSLLAAFPFLLTSNFHLLLCHIL